MPTMSGGDETLQKAYGEFLGSAYPLQQIRTRHAFQPKETMRLIWKILAEFEDTSEESIQRLARGLSKRRR